MADTEGAGPETSARPAPRGLNLDWVTPHMAVGGRYPMEAAAHLAQALGVRHVVDLRVEACDDEAVLRTHGLTLLHLPTEDTCAVSQEHLHSGVHWVCERLSREERVYIHCEHGVGRSALLALCVLVARGASPREALELAKARRPQVSPSPEQLHALLTFAEGWRARTGATWELPSWHALADLAYGPARGP